MTDPEIHMAQCAQMVLNCCNKKPVFAYEPGYTTLTCEKCGMTEGFADFSPGVCTARWNARILGPEEFIRLNKPGFSLTANE
ncbi:MAG: hypothetical protein GY811_05950 [Myxococcales bacterium]|nr:hypothetical protein [Myxococcales bacterium]